jgi:hypothetical protein
VSVSASPECWIAARLAPLHELACEEPTTVFQVPDPRFAALLGANCQHDIDLKRPQSQASRSSQLLKGATSEFCNTFPPKAADIARVNAAPAGVGGSIKKAPPGVIPARRNIIST